MKNYIPIQFKSDRLTMCELFNGADKTQLADLAEETIAILTPTVLKSLPEHWQKDYDYNSATSWLETQSSESKLLLIREKKHPSLIGFLILFEQENLYHLGYLLGAKHWGKGYGKELILALIDYLKSSGWKGSLAGGVSKENIASIKILEKCGFIQAPAQDVQELKFILKII